ncbi:MAG TPA: YbaB/EbfC family nucleoid-associated protein [Alphaproteobacteria bacterium]|nr:YbaB/EbfC family nucleoid-associated protein [Alphaproteobacteria bacterium]HBA43049.1 YbaB/EbfC family nucleoid-associated protein [Alphaproteobacteria bacterium]HBF99631.1 YbaB/EbfC family nucleoid-associated protein [Alphaproteobacteria bacterium]HCO92292.1 YbaB/EbfC family nucleoid-associated protein [Alphaproteobacteria bacterium]
MKDLGKLFKQAQEMQSRMTDMQSQLAALEVAGQSGGGMVRVTLDGKGNMKSVAIDPSLLNGGEAELLEDLLVAAHNDAKGRVEEKMQEEMQKLTGGMSLPPGFKMPF